MTDEGRPTGLNVGHPIGPGSKSTILGGHSVGNSASADPARADPSEDPTRLADPRSAGSIDPGSDYSVPTILEPVRPGTKGSQTIAPEATQQTGDSGPPPGIKSPTKSPDGSHSPTKNSENVKGNGDDPGTDAEPDKISAVDQFMLEEYKTIANAHFDLHSGLRQNFRFYLGIVAVPFTVMAVAFKDAGLVLFSLPDVLTLLFCVTPAIGVLMFIHMVNTRFDIILYTRTVNGVRAYFVERAKSLCSVPDPTPYLKLPTNQLRPPYREGPSRAFWWLFCLVALLNSVYAFVAAANFLILSGAILAALVTLVAHGVVYYGLSREREQREIPSAKRT